MEMAYLARGLRSVAFAASILALSCCRRSVDGAAQSDQATPGTSALSTVQQTDTLNQRRAIELVKRSRNVLPKLSIDVDLELGPGANNDTEHMLMRRFNKAKGDLHLNGWSASRQEPDTYLVEYTYLHDGDIGGCKFGGCPFEVILSGEVVRFIIGDTVLEQKYGWTQR